MSGLFDADDDATPLTPDERNGLIPAYVAHRSELNELEQQNIAEADSWAFRRKRDVFNEKFLKRLHGKMFERVWKWAGEYRTTGRNIGVEPYLIQPALRQATDDARYWNGHDTYLADEIAVRFHHRLVQIHPFPNGNGRWSRLAADLFLAGKGSARLTWGRESLQSVGEIRRLYIDALRSADRHDYGPLIRFIRQ